MARTHEEDVRIKTKLTVTLVAALLLAGCSKAEQTNVAQQNADNLCINRQDLKLLLRPAPPILKLWRPH